MFFSVTLFATYSQPTFKKFTITAETANNVILDVPTGHFEIEQGSEIFSKFSTNCPNTVIESNLVPKTEISVSIILPTQRPKVAYQRWVLTILIMKKLLFLADDHLFTIS